MIRYTLLRLLVFFVALLALALIPALRNDPFLLVLIAALVSAGLSFFLLGDMRDEMTSRWLDRREQRLQARDRAGQVGTVAGADEAAEDSESDRR